MDKPNMWLELTGTLSGVPPGTGKPDGKYVYQRTGRGKGNIAGDPTGRQQVRRHVIPNNPRTAQQGAQRGRFALGVTAWHGLTPDDKTIWKQNGKKYKLGAFQMFMRVWCLSTELPTFTEWDGGTTTWDSGTTTWI